MLHRRLAKVQVAGLVIELFAPPVSAAELIEAIGGEKCAKPPKPYTVEFLAPEHGDLQASAKGIVDELEDLERPPPALSLDGKPCLSGRCSVRASKGRTYALTAKRTYRKFAYLCIWVARPCEARGSGRCCRPPARCRRCTDLAALMLLEQRATPGSS